MELTEAKRRLESTSIARGYQTTGRWVEKMHDDEATGIYSMALTNMPQTRLVLWRNKGQWWGMIAVQIGEDGEYPITGSEFDRDNSCHMSVYPFMLPRIIQIQYQVARWKYERADPWADKAMMKLAIWYLKQANIKKAVSVLMTAIRGELDEATAAEALSIVQWKYCKTKEEMMISARIWGEVFR